MPATQSPVVSTGEYYDRFQSIYRSLWAGRTYAIHYGIWDQTTRTHEDALLNTNRIVANAASITRGDSVLDCGCGMGGSSFWLAEHQGVTVVGITSSKRQARFALAKSARLTSPEQVSFSVQDFHRSAFRDAAFTVVWAIESVYHTSAKESFLIEARRLLVPGGRLVVADWFVNPSVAEYRRAMDKEVQLRAIVEQGYLVSVEHFATLVARCDFGGVHFSEYTEHTQPSVERIYRICRLASPILAVLDVFKAVPGSFHDAVRGGLVQRYLVRTGVLRYGVFSALKIAGTTATTE